MKFARWSHLLEDPDHTPPWSMDWRHVQMIHALLVHERPRSVVEIGTYRGGSAAAIIEAMEADPEIDTATLVDEVANFDVTHAGALYPHRLHYLVTRSEQIKGLRGEAWILDGDHEHHALGDLHRALDGDARFIVVHDTSIHLLGVPGHQGSLEVWNTLRKRAGGFCWSDNLRRPGERTERGLGIAFLQGWPKPETLEALGALT